MAETEVRCPLVRCVYNRFKGRCIKKVITLKRLDLNVETSVRIRCDDYRVRL